MTPRSSEAMDVCVCVCVCWSAAPAWGETIGVVAFFETADGTALYYETRGSGPPVFVCQGGPSTSFDALAPSLEPLEASHTMIYHDYRGCGRSGNSETDLYRFEQLADDLDQLRVHLGLDNVMVLAHSMGGFVALHFALRHGQHCDRIEALRSMA